MPQGTFRVAHDLDRGAQTDIGARNLFDDNQLPADRFPRTAAQRLRQLARAILRSTFRAHEMQDLPLIRIAAGVLTNAGGRMLVVRKRGTASFMQPAGKLRKGESDLGALARELREELGISVDVRSARYLGMFTAASVLEAGCLVKASLFHLPMIGQAAPMREIEELAWIGPDDATEVQLAPLTREQVLPLLPGLTSETSAHRRSDPVTFSRTTAP
jgi:8-oxo-dGTP diphosphatase